MSLLVDVLLLAVSFGVILLGAELFTNAIEWFGKKLGLGTGMVGSVLAAVGTALPETMIPIIALVFVGGPAAEEVGIGAILGAPFMLSTAAMFVTGTAVLFFARRGRRKRTLSIDQRIVGRDLRFFLGMYILAIVLGLPLYEKPVRLQPNLTTPHTRVVVAQLIVSLAAIAGGAQLFVREITVLSPLVGITPLVLSLIIAPIATELPEKFNSVLWV